VKSNKLFLIYLSVPKKISEKIFEINKLISRRFPENSYSAFYKGKWQSHIMLYLSPMDMADKENIIREIRSIAEGTKTFRVVFDDFEKASGNYLFVGIKDEPKGSIKGLHNKIVRALLPFRDGVIKEKYLQKWESFSSEERERIKSTGVPYEYVPHTSVATLGSEKEVLEAINEIKNLSPKGVEFEVKRIEIMTSNVDDYEDKEIVSSFDIS
jgi:hypothetical protein